LIKTVIGFDKVGQSYLLEKLFLELTKSIDTKKFEIYLFREFFLDS